MDRAQLIAFFSPIVAAMAFDAVVLAVLAWAYHAERFAPYRISPKVSMRVSAQERMRNIGFNAVLSVFFVFGIPYGLYAYAGAFHVSGDTTLARKAFEVLAILVVYDFAYYWLHRIMHTKWGMKYVHGVHHRVHNPTAMESFYLSPLEMFAGLALLGSVTWLVGPVHVHSYAAVFVLHSTLNITVHSGLVSGRWWLKPIDHLTHKHYIHHAGDIDKNYASLTPLPDMLFGTRG